MSIRTVTAILALGITTASGGAFGMNDTIGKLPQCRVIGWESLPSHIRGPKALCAAIDAAIQEQAQGTPYTIEIRVLSAHSLAAAVTLENGQTLPEQRMAVSDRELNRGSIDRFAEAVAAEIGKAIKQ